MNALMIPTAALTMSSCEIADLLETRHDAVKLSMERLAERGVITLPPLEEVSNPGPGPKTIKVYSVGKRDSYVVVAQLSPEFTARLVDRWQELETAASDPMKALSDPARLRQVLLGYAEEVIALEHKVLEQAPKVEVHDRIADAAGSLAIRETANTIGIPERKFVLWLLEHEWCYRRAGHKSLLAYSDKVKAGLLCLKQTPIRDIHTGEERLSEQVRVTPLGLTKLAKLLMGEKAAA